MSYFVGYCRSGQKLIYLISKKIWNHWIPLKLASCLKIVMLILNYDFSLIDHLQELLILIDVIVGIGARGGQADCKQSKDFKRRHFEEARRVGDLI